MVVQQRGGSEVERSREQLVRVKGVRQLAGMKGHSAALNGHRLGSWHTVNLFTRFVG